MFADLLRVKECPVLSAPECLASWQLIRVRRWLLALGDDVRCGGVPIALLGLNLGWPF
jgi:hypothetical protein